MNTLATNKADRCYIMLDRKGADLALVKVGITSDTLKNRIHSYRTANPFLELVAICEVRKNQNLHKVEEMFFDYMREVRGYEHAFGEWVVVTNAADIDAIETEGFRFFEKLFYRTKNNEFYREQVRNLWNYRKR